MPRTTDIINGLLITDSEKLAAVVVETGSQIPCFLTVANSTETASGLRRGLLDGWGVDSEVIQSPAALPGHRYCLAIKGKIPESAGAVANRIMDGRG